MTRVTVEQSKEIVKKYENEEFKNLVDTFGKEMAMKIETDEYLKLRETLASELSSILDITDESISQEEFNENLDRWIRDEYNKIKLEKVRKAIREFGFGKLIANIPLAEEVLLIKKIVDIRIK